MSPNITGPNHISPLAGRETCSLSERTAFGRNKQVSNTVRDYLSLFFKYKTWICIVFCFIVVASVVGIYSFYTPRYMAKSNLLVKFGWENYSPDLTSSESKRFSTINQAEMIQSEVRILRSRDQINRVLTVLKPETIYPSLAVRSEPGVTNAEVAAFSIERDLNIVPAKGNVIEVSLTGTNPQGITAVVNQLVSIYIDKRSEIFSDPKSALFLQQKADEYAQKLTASENRLKTFRNETKIVSFEEQRRLLVDQRSYLDQKLNDCEAQIKQLTEKIAEYDKQMKDVPEQVSDARSGLALRITPTEQKLLDLKIQEQVLLSRYKEDNRLLQGVREQIKLAEEYLERQSKLKPAEMTNPVWENIQSSSLSSKAELRASKIKETTLQRQITDLEARMQAFEGLEQKNNELIRDVTSNEEKLRSYRQKLETARIQDELEHQKMTSVSIIERASIPVIPINPLRLPILIPAVLAIAILGSFGSCFILQLLSHGIGTPTDAEKRLGIPVLIAVPIKPIETRLNNVSRVL